MLIAETPRLRLRHFELYDAAPLSSILADPEVMRFSVSGPRTLEQTRGLIEGCRADYARDGFALYAVDHRQDDRLIGYCGLMFQQVDGEKEVEVGYRLHRRYWGAGLGTEAAQATVTDAVDRLRLTRLVALIEAENVASVRVAEKIGMHWEKDARFHDIPVRAYSIALDQERRAQHRPGGGKGMHGIASSPGTEFCPCSNGET